MPTFIGLDLAWSPNKESGICWLTGDSADSLTCERLTAEVSDMNDVAAEISRVEGSVVVTIDAPVLYSPERDVEREIARRFGKYKAAAHSPHPHVKAGRKTGIDLGEALCKRGFTCDPRPLLKGDRPTRTAVEVYPHTIHVRLFKLAERLKYKKGRVADKRAGLLQYQWHLEALIRKVAPKVLGCAEVQCALDPETARNARGKSLKRLDDTLDGLTCALAAWLIWREPERWEMIGDLNGYIVAPR
ncbi:MAG: DUF429 domain-containing protein [Chloroflexi bacterium]|nr:DUF429 domain-containing protein [Chloroflexota bacterium]MCY3696634.1 DUF429 domain-containing protein [Chloroflexota bacterium]